MEKVQNEQIRLYNKRITTEPFINIAFAIPTYIINVSLHDQQANNPFKLFDIKLFTNGFSYRI